MTPSWADVVAAASFYGGGIAGEQGFGGQPSTVGRTGQIEGRMLCLFGGKDAHIPMSDVDAVRGALESNDIPHEVVVYPEADHGFFCDQRGSYNEAAATDAWERVKALFAEELGS